MSDKVHYKKKEEVIVQLESFGRVLEVTPDTVVVVVGKFVYRLPHSKVKKIIPDEQESETQEELTLW